MVPDTEVLRRTELPSIQTMLAKAQLRMLSACKKNVCPKDCCMVSFWKERDLLEVNVSGRRIR